MAERRDRTERLMNLVLCLLGTSRPVPRNVIEQSVEGYGDASSATAFERMFERDKDDLRSLGIPIETVSDIDGTVIGYRIPHDQYQPVQLNVTAHQARVIGLVPLLWQGEWAHTATLASKKLELQASDRPHSTTQMPGFVGAAVPPPPSVGECIDALSTPGNVLEFVYEALDGSRTQRSVIPQRVRVREGVWYLWGFDLERSAHRTFRLSRMSEVQKSRIHNSVTIPDISPFEEDTERAQITVVVGRDRGAELRMWATHVSDNPRDDATELISVGADPWRLRWLLLRAGDSAFPADGDASRVIADVRAAAERIRASHSVVA